jgi:hypothetical protein
MDHIGATALQLVHSEVFNQLEKLETSIESEGVNLFPIAFQKSERLSKKLRMLRDAHAVRLVIITIPNLMMTSVTDDRISSVELIDTLEYEVIFDALANGNQPTIVLFTNNLIPHIGFKRFADLTGACSNCLFLMHDYDNHHWYRMSIFGALVSDVYVQAHRHNMPYLDTLLPHPTLTIPIGVTQWERQFILDSVDKILNAKRGDLPSGMHRFYPRFEQRNRIIATIANHAPDVGFTDSTRFNAQSQEEKLEDWVRTKVQLCAPAGHDIPTRFFDSLITGGLPAIPFRMVDAIRSVGVREDHFISFGPLDLVSPEAAIRRWCARFDELGREGLLSRVTHCIENFHVDRTIRNLLDVTFSLAAAYR